MALKASSSSSSPLLAAQTNPSFTLFLFYLRLFSFFSFSAGLHSEKEGKEENGHSTLVVPYLNPSILFHLLPCRFRHLKWGRPKFSFFPFSLLLSLSLFSGLPLGGKTPDRQTECGPLVEKSGLSDVGWAVHSSCRGKKGISISPRPRTTPLQSRDQPFFNNLAILHIFLKPIL